MKSTSVHSYHPSTLSDNDEDKTDRINVFRIADFLQLVIDRAYN